MTKKEKKALFVIFLIVATELIGFGLIIPVLPQLALQFQTGSFYLALLMGAYSLAQFFAAPYLGHLSDKLGRKPVLLASKIGTVLSYVILAFAQNYWWFLIARLLDGFTGGNISVARATIADITSAKNRSKGMAIIGISFGLGFVFGPALGGILYTDAFGHRIPALVAGSLSLVACVLTKLMLEEPEKHKEYEAKPSLVSALRTFSKRPIIAIFGTYFFYMIIFSGFETSFALFTFHIFGLSTKQNSLLFMYAGVLSLLIQGSMTRYTPKNLKRTTSIGLVITAISFLCYAGTQNIISLLLFMGLMCLGIGLVNVFLPSLLSVYGQSQRQGTLMGVYESIGSLSRILGPFAAYSFILFLPREGYFSFGVVLFIVAALFSTLTPNRDSGEKAA